MRILWDEPSSRFLAELTPGDKWREDMESAKAAGFKTEGPPSWQWFASKASVLNKLREHRPSSGLSLTEVALQHYKRKNDEEEKLAALKKQLESAKKDASKAAKIVERETDNNEYYFEPETGGTFIVVKPAEKPFVSKYVRPEPPAERCMVCEEPIYFYESPNICLFCEKELDTNLKV